MSIDAVLQFFESASEDRQVQLQFRAMTDVREFVQLGKRLGYEFSNEELAEATTNSSQDQASPEKQPHFLRHVQGDLSDESKLLHYQWNLADVEGLEGVSQELQNLKIKPSTVDMQQFEARFRQDDCDFADLSPTQPAFRQHYKAMMSEELRSNGQHDLRRSFHLVNLDHHVDHEEYEEYFRAKTRLVSRLEEFFGDEVRFSGSMWYPPNSYRAWHTNATQPGWRLYLVDFDAPDLDIGGKSFFRYMNPQSGDVVTLPERPKLLRCFKIEQKKGKRLWHCVVNKSNVSRWSFGFAVNETWLEKVAGRV